MRLDLLQTEEKVRQNIVFCRTLTKDSKLSIYCCYVLRMWQLKKNNLTHLACFEALGSGVPGHVLHVAVLECAAAGDKAANVIGPDEGYEDGKREGEGGEGFHDERGEVKWIVSPSFESVKGRMNLYVPTLFTMSLRIILIESQLVSFRAVNLESVFQHLLLYINLGLGPWSDLQLKSFNAGAPKKGARKSKHLTWVTGICFSENYQDDSIF